VKILRLLLALVIAVQLGGLPVVAGGVCPSERESGHSCCSSSDSAGNQTMGQDCGCLRMPAESQERDLPAQASDGLKHGLDQPCTGVPHAFPLPAPPPGPAAETFTLRPGGEALSFLSGGGFRC
jgi:hypothetical protein